MWLWMQQQPYHLPADLHQLHPVHHVRILLSHGVQRVNGLVEQNPSLGFLFDIFQRKVFPVGNANTRRETRITVIATMCVYVRLVPSMALDPFCQEVSGFDGKSSRGVKVVDGLIRQKW